VRHRKAGGSTIHPTYARRERMRAAEENALKTGTTNRENRTQQRKAITPGEEGVQAGTGTANKRVCCRKWFARRRQTATSPNLAPRVHRETGAANNASSEGAAVLYMVSHGTGREAFRGGEQAAEKARFSAEP